MVRWWSYALPRMLIVTAFSTAAIVRRRALINYHLLEVRALLPRSKERFLQAMGLECHCA